MKKLYAIIVVLITISITINQSEGVSMAAFTASPSMPSPRTSRLLLMIMRRAQRPVEITAAGIVRLSLETFGSVCIPPSLYYPFSCTRRKRSYLIKYISGYTCEGEKHVIVYQIGNHDIY